MIDFIIILCGLDAIQYPCPNLDASLANSS